MDEKETESIFTGLSFKYPPISKEDYILLYDDYVRRCSINESQAKKHVIANSLPLIDTPDNLHDSIINIVRKEIKKALNSNVIVTIQSSDIALQSVEDVSNKIVQALQDKNINQ